MEHNEISMFMDVKLDIHDKRAVALKFKSWTRCQVKIEAIKCLPCFLRITFQQDTMFECTDTEEQQQQQTQKSLSVSINVPGVTISLATSRTKQHSYGLFWTQNRRDCFIYFALETELSCRRHMKWIKKSIKNLELYRQVFLEQRRYSRGPGRLNSLTVVDALDKQQELSAVKSALSALGPLPKIPDANCSVWSNRVSEIYEEIFEQTGSDISRLSRRYSRSSIASGIYEEMKPHALNFNAIMEEPPRLPPLPPPRKRVNTFQNDAPDIGSDEIPRCNTNPESDLAKKKKYKNVLDNIFGSARIRKRAESVSECAASPQQQLPEYINMTPKSSINIHTAQRNSFSSPDLSKLNFLDTFDEAHVADMLKCIADNADDDESADDDLNLSLDDSAILPLKNKLIAQINAQLAKSASLESLNVSEQLPNNFNFSACNTSTINLIGSNGAVPHANLAKNQIVIDELNGYCIMAPIVKKSSTTTTESTTSGYSTGSYSSTTSSASSANCHEPHPAITVRPLTEKPHNDSVIYEHMSNSPAPASSAFTEHLYENLLAVKAAQELEQPIVGLSTSTPTESPQLALTNDVTAIVQQQTEEEDYYQTPRKSIISIDDKIPSYYPNSCDTAKSKRQSSQRSTPTSEKSNVGLRHLVNMKMRRERKENVYITSPQKINEQRTQKSETITKSIKSNKQKKTAHKIADNVYAVTHAHKKSTTTQAATTTATTTTSSTATNNNNDNCFNVEMQEKLQVELLQLAMLQNIDFKFDDGQQHKTPSLLIPKSQQQQQATQKPFIKMSAAQSEQIKESDEYENCYHAAERATRLLHKYATLAKFGSGISSKPTITIKTTKDSPSPIAEQLQQQKHYLQVNQAANTSNTLSPTASVNNGENITPKTMTQSAVTPTDMQLSSSNSGKKFASLPRFKKIDFSPLKMRINNVLQRNQHHDF